jgi:hypothetical protein
VRLPSLIAASVLLILVLVAARSVTMNRAVDAAEKPSLPNTARLGILAIGILSVMPLHVVVGRMAITDATLSASWFAALLGGLRAIQTTNWRWNVVLWLGIAVGLMVKGPLALMPLAVILLWLMLARNLRALRLTHPLIGFPLAAAPVLVWAVLVAREYPDAMKIWVGQTAGRLVGEEGTNAHTAPPWYYLPVFLAGLFPATIMLSMPWLNISWREAWRALRAGDERALWSIAVILPLLFFTAMSGKLATYLLPLAGPCALLGAMTLERWLAGEFDRPSERYKPPEIVITLCVVTIVLAALALVGVLRWAPHLLPCALLMMPMALVSAWLCLNWKRRPHARLTGLIAAWAAGVVAWMGLFGIEDALRAPSDQHHLVDHLRAVAGSPRPRIAIFGFRDPCIEFYARGSVTLADECKDLTDLIAGDARDVVLLADAHDWAVMAAANRHCSDAFVTVEHTERWFNKTMDIMRPSKVVGPPASLNAAPIADTQSQ